MNSVKDLFYVDSKSAKSDLLPIIMEMESEYRNTNKVGKELRNKLFNSAWNAGRVVDQTYIEQYGDVREDLKGRKIKIEPSFKGDIPDFSDLKKRYSGTLSFSNSGTPIDLIYQELSTQNPGIFDPEITHPADQLIAIMDTLDDIRLHESSLDVTFKDDPDFKQYVWNNMNKAIKNFQYETDLTIRYEKYRAELKGKAEETDPLPAEQIQSIYKEKQRLEKIKYGVSRKVLLNDKDRVQLDRLLKGEIEFSELPRDINYNGIKQMYDIQKQIYDAMEPITRYNKARKQALNDKAMELLKNSMKWTDKVTGLQYSRETMERNIRDITHNSEETKAINDYLFKPIHDHEAAATRFKNEFRNRVREMKLTKIESELVQKYGEGEIKAEDFYALNVDHAKIEKTIKEFRTIYSDLFDRINVARVQNGYAPMEFRKDYFPHFSERMSLLAKIGKRLGMEIHDESLPTDIAGLTHTFRPGIKWFANALRRQGTKTAYDAVEGFNRYIEGAADIIYHTEDIQKLRSFEQALRYKHSDTGLKDEIENIRENNNLTDDEKNAQIDDLTRGEINNLGHFATELRSYTDNLAGKKSFSDRSIEQDVGRRYYALASAMEGRVASNMVALNPGSWLTNFIPITQASSQVSMQSMTKALEATMKNYVENDGFEIESTFLTNRLGSESLTKTNFQKVSETLAAPMQWIDEFTSNVVVRAKYYENMKNGMDQTSALADADQFAADLIADRSKGSMPTLFNRKNPITKLFTQFQLEQNNQLSYLLKDIPRDLKDKGLKAILMALLKYSIGAYLYNEIYGMLTGRHPALDPIRMVKDAVLRFTDEDKKKSEAVLETGKDVLEQVPFVGGLMGGGRLPINSALPNMTNVINASAGLASGEMNERKAKDTLSKELSKPAYYFLPPVAGGQAKKFFEGMSAIGRGGVFGVDSEGKDTLKYFVEPTFENTLKSAVFGPTSTEQGKKWVDSGFPSLSGKRTEAYKDLVTAGINMKYAYEFMEYVKSLKGLKDANGNTIPNSKSALMIEKLQGLGLQGQELKGYIQDNGDNLGMSSKIQEMTVEDIRKLIKECREKEGK
ncbi:hypothetical protein [Holdemania massiliensis]|uniref:hypothetical protein n=1 Tax=Holdemania massiliensis TaxID=1468449 RepID=UPI00242AC94D|nr:hypothetical protein [Holdemania massiliensis]